MRFLRVVLVLVFAALAALYTMNSIQGTQSVTDEGPELSCSTEVLNISVRDSRNALLRGVTATDAQDGSLTDRIIISGVSKLTGDDTATVTYVVVDSDNNIASMTRQLHYTDYESPRFSLEEPLVYPSIENVALLDRLHAEDAIDGDITNDIRVSYAQTTDDPELYTIDVKVTNSMGDTVEQTLPVVIREDLRGPEIDLIGYLIYLERGSEFDPEALVEEITYNGKELSVRDLEISGEVDTEVPGTYDLAYSCEYDDFTSMVMVTVVVE